MSNIERLKKLLIDFKNNGYEYHLNDNQKIKLTSDKFDIVDSEGYLYNTNINILHKNAKRKSKLSWLQGNIHAIQNIKNYIKLYSIPYEVISEEYEGYNKPMIFNCKEHGNFNMSFAHISRGDKCQKCVKSYRRNINEVKQTFIDKGYIPTFDTFNNVREKLTCIDAEGYKIVISLVKLLGDRKPMIFGYLNPYTIENIKLWLKNNNPEYKLLSTEYISSSKKLLFYCNKHNCEFSMTWNHMYSGETCSKCHRERTSGKNHHGYNSDLTDEERVLKRAYLGKDAMKFWKLDIHKKDDYICQCCGKRGGELHAHHLDGYGWCREKRVDKNNGITLCKECHKEFHVLYGKRDNTEDQFIEYYNDIIFLDSKLKATTNN